MLRTVAIKIFGSKNERELKRLWPIVQRVNSFESTFQQESDAQLRAKTTQFRERLDRGESLDDLLPEAFALVREGSRRALGMRHFDVQLIGGMVLHEGKIAEMKTGEGKTLCATLPVYLNALTGKGVHVVTVNDYLAKRDSEWMGRLYGFLGMTTGTTVHGLSHAERKTAYGADITYGQNNEFGFDYLRDNMVVETDEMVQRPHNFAIVDEVDSILIDEARTPLIISGPSEDSSDRYKMADQIVRQLQIEVHYTVELKSKQVMLTDEGVKRVEELLQLDNLYDPRHILVVHHVNQALSAHVSYQLDVDYVVRQGQIVIVDEFTGRLMPGRRWSNGLHQAVEAKEGVKIVRESQTVATITFQNYFRMYKKLAGMTGTADTEAVEFKKIYSLDVVVIPTNKPMIRSDHADVVFATERGKFRSVCEEIGALHEKGQPVLVGTASIAKSEMLSEILKEKGIPHHVLNAKHHEREADIVAQAGRLGAVTISTNMAGRGTDILLGGNPEFLAAASAGTRDPNDPAYQEKLVESRSICIDEKAKVLEAGGLHILGTERHESRRIDNQLRGRGGRQGDPGTSRFYVSLEDDLMKRFGGERMQALMARAGMTDEDAIEGRLVSHAIENAQKKVEGYHFDIRKHLIEYDDVMNKQRGVVYSLRSKILRSEDIEKEFLEIIPDAVEEIVLLRANEKEVVEKWDVRGMFEEFSKLLSTPISGQPFVDRQEHSDAGIAQEIFDEVRAYASQRYAEKKSQFGEELMLRIIRLVFLEAIDHYWREHLGGMDHLKEGVGLRGYAQRNPLHEYQREAFHLFSSMMASVKLSVVARVFSAEVKTEEQIRQEEEMLKAEQKRLESQAREVHENVLDAPEGNRDSGSAVAADASRRSPVVLGQIQSAKTKKDAQRKKNKAAKEARRKSR